MMARKPKVEGLEKMKKPMRLKTRASTNKEKTKNNQTTTFVPSTCYPLNCSSQFTTKSN
jgi:hypothetical protein